MNMPIPLTQPTQDVCNAREHGLVGNGTANDQPALAALVERLGAEFAADGRPRIIYCPPGEYLVADAVTVWRSGVSLFGAGAGATRFVLDNAENREVPMVLARFTEALDGASPKKHLADCTFACFEIEGARVSMGKYDTHAKGLDLQYMVRATFRDIHIFNTAATGLGCDHLQDSVIESVMAVNCGRLNDGRQPGGAGIGIGVGGWGSIERLSINDCIAVGNATNGIFVELQKGKWPPPRGIKITGGHCVDNRYGISDWGCDGLIVSACVMCENHEVGFDVSAQGVSQIGGRGGLVTDCTIDGNGRDGVSIGNTNGPYTVRGNRISNNGRYGYHEHNIKGDPEPAHEIAVETNEIWGNGLDGIRIEAPTIDASLVRNRIRNNGRCTERGASGEGEGVIYEPFLVRDANANWPVDGHKGKTVLVAGMPALVVKNSATELSLFPYRPGAKTAWEKGVPDPGTLYVMQDAPPVRAGIAVAVPATGAWITGNRIWERQPRHTQTHALWLADGAAGNDCRIDDNAP
jgi:hypothetical protein